MNYEPDDHFDDRLTYDCYGEFSPRDMVCRAHCALRLPCAVEHNRLEQLAALEALAAPVHHPSETSH